MKILGLVIPALFINQLFNLSLSPPPPQPTPGQEEDRLAIPTPPANPTPIEQGKIVYYYHCMPCHGDVGQGLTDEWRQVWVEDHRNCWARGCHAGRQGDEGFPIPRYIPEVTNLPQYKVPADLHDYLHETHPPQEPGRLSDDQYWSVTAFLFFLSGRVSQADSIRLEPSLNMSLQDLLAIFAIIAIIVVVGLLFVWQTRGPSRPSKT
jgi:hypothetical protein